MTLFCTLDTFDTEFAADSVEWCPLEPFRDILVCGTYELAKDEGETSSKEKKTIKRLGRIYVFRMIDNGKLTTLQQINVPAVLDMKWMHVANRNRILLAVVTASGYLQIYEIKNQENKFLKLIAEQRVNNNEDEVIALSLDWSTGRYDSCETSDPNIVVSDSRGCISRFTLHDNDLIKDFSWCVHKFEAWIAAFDYWQTCSFYTGGDDCKFQVFDTRVGPHAVVHNTQHNAGVTSIHSNATKEFILATGSYDEILRLWDKRNLKQSLSETNLSGGIWRLKWDPFLRQYLFAACMYGGFQLVNCKYSNIPVIVGEYKEHESISYGCDWSFLTKKTISDRYVSKESDNYHALVSTCSFYDHVLKLSAIYSEREDWVNS